MKTKLLLAVLLSCIYMPAQQGVYPPELGSSPGNNGLRLFYPAIFNPIKIGTVVDGLLPTTINSIAFRPTYANYYSTLTYSALVLNVTLKVSYGAAVDTMGMTSANTLIPGTTTTILNAATVSFPQSSSVFPPNIGLNAIASEPFRYKFVFPTPYSHPGGNFQFTIDYTTLAQPTPLDPNMDTLVIADWQSASNAYSIRSNGSDIDSSMPNYCMNGGRPYIDYTNANGPPPNNYYSNYLEASGWQNSAIFITTSLASVPFSWPANNGNVCTVDYDLSSSLVIPYTNWISLDVGANPALQKQYYKTINFLDWYGNGYTSSTPSVMTFPIVYPARSGSLGTYNVPSTRTLLSTTIGIDTWWINPVYIQ